MVMAPALEGPGVCPVSSSTAGVITATCPDRIVAHSSTVASTRNGGVPADGSHTGAASAHPRLSRSSRDYPLLSLCQEPHCMTLALRFMDETVICRSRKPGEKGCLSDHSSAV